MFEFFQIKFKSQLLRTSPYAQLIAHLAFSFRYGGQTAPAREFTKDAEVKSHPPSLSVQKRHSGAVGRLQNWVSVKNVLRTRLLGLLFLQGLSAVCFPLQTLAFVFSQLFLLQKLELNETRECFQIKSKFPGMWTVHWKSWQSVQGRAASSLGLPRLSPMCALTLEEEQSCGLRQLLKEISQCRKWQRSCHSWD